MKTLKILTVVFGFGLAGVVTCFCMTIFTAVRLHQAKQAQIQSAPLIPMPALPER